jgi:cytochrome P450
MLGLEPAVTLPANLETLPNPYHAIRDLGLYEVPPQRVKWRTEEGFFVARYQDVKAALTDLRLSNDSNNLDKSTGEVARDIIPPGNILTLDPPDHTRLRRLVQPSFTQRSINQLRQRVQLRADELIENMAAKGEAEIINDFGEPLPTMVISEILGVPYEDREQFTEWAKAMLTPPIDETDRAQIAVMHDAQQKMASYFTEIIERTKKNPTDSILGSLITVREGGDKLSDAELLSMMIVLLVAGFETTINLLGTGTYQLARNPDAWAALKENPSLVPNAVEEMLRFEGPIFVDIFRYTKEDLNINGTEIPRGSRVYLSLGAANRDPAQYANADVFNIHRENIKQLGFGRGIHLCLGAPLARLEAQIAFASMVQRFSKIRLAMPESEIRWRHHTMRGLDQLHVTVA